MSEIDPLVAEILLKGDDEFLSRIKQVGENAASSWEKLTAAFDKGQSSVATAVQAFSLVEAALAGLTAATVAFIEQQTALTQKTQLLSEAFGTTSGQLQEIEAVFASSGVSVEQFERFANRLTITIAREWPAIAESIKTYANENDAAQLRVSTAILRVQDAQKALADNSADRAAQISRDNNALEASYIKLQFAAQHAASEQVSAAQTVRGAQLSSAAALQHLQELQGNPPSAAQKQQLAIAQAQQSLDQARHAEADARIAQQEKAATAALKQAQLEQEYDDLSRKAAKNARDDAEQRIKDQNSVKEAIIARGEAEQRAEKFALTSVKNIRDALDGIVSGNKEAAKSIDLTQVSVENLKRAFIAQAAEAAKNGKAPDGFETLRSVAKTLAADTDHLISREERLAIVNRLAATSMQAIGSSGAEILDVLENNSEAFERVAHSVDKFNEDVKPETIKAFRGALAELNLQVSLLSQRFAAAIAPALTAFLNALRESLTSNTGAIHNFLSALQGIGGVVARVIDGAGILADRFRIFDEIIGKADALKAALIGIGVAITVATGPIGVMVVAIGLVITAIGSIRDNWDNIVAHVRAAWDAVQDNAVVQFLERVLDVILKIVKGIASIAGFKFGGGGGGGASADGGGSESGTEGFAEGGPIKGPGTGTSDSILARLSNGEFVVKARAVEAYGANLFHALNNMQIPGFASGGLATAGPAIGTGKGLSGVQASRPLNLTIGERTFSGLRGPAGVINDLANFAVSRQTSTAGSRPSWVK